MAVRNEWLVLTDQGLPPDYQCHQILYFVARHVYLPTSWSALRLNEHRLARRHWKWLLSPNQALPLFCHDRAISRCSAPVPNELKLSTSEAVLAPRLNYHGRPTFYCRASGVNEFTWSHWRWPPVKRPPGWRQWNSCTRNCWLTNTLCLQSTSTGCPGDQKTSVTRR